MPLRYDGQIDIATGHGAQSKTWRNKPWQWSDLITKLADPVRTPETYKEFMRASKTEQSKIKDVGGFVGGYLNSGKRNKNSILYRQLIALDIDFSNANIWWDFTLLYDCAAVIHSTHKSSPTSMRHRLLIPLDRTVGAEEYQAISRMIAADLGIDNFDQSTFDVNRLMFWPSVSIDAEYYFEYQDGPWLNADSILARYNDWTNVNEWPVAASDSDFITEAIAKQEDPLEKSGIVGVFCRAYTIQEVIETFLTDSYKPAGDGRYTYIKGSTAAGLVTYDNKFAYSHHGTDPAGGRLCNAFDLVRIHKFGHLDTGKSKGDTDSKSYKQMEQFATKDAGTRKQIAEEKLAEAKLDFAEGVSLDEEYDNSWIAGLEANRAGEYTSSANNINLILQNDQFLHKAFKFNTFDNKRYINKTMPWRIVTKTDYFKDVDYSGVRNYIECVYGITASGKIDDALALEFERHSFHPIQEYIKSITWDHQNRIDTLLIDYFGAENNAYTRGAIRKTLCAAVARVFEPGIKFDLVLILSGPQGTYKSTFVKKLGMDWFSDTFSTVQGKEAFEQIQGAWLIEIGELAGLKKAEVETIKHFVSKREDSFRPAYGRVIETYKRQCVFIGTTNSSDFLRDATGNRRFMPIDVRTAFVTKSVVDDLTQYEVDQIWAEAYQLYKANEALYLIGDEEIIAKESQTSHTEMDERAGMIQEYLDKLYPANWDEMDLFHRIKWLEDPLSEKGTVRKEAVCIAEIWTECLGKQRWDMTRYNTREINDIMKSLHGWEYVNKTKRFSIYGAQRYFKRI